MDTEGLGVDGDTFANLSRQRDGQPFFVDDVVGDGEMGEDLGGVDGDEVDAEPVVVGDPRFGVRGEFVEVEVIVVQVLEKGVMVLGGDGPGFETGTPGFVGRVDDGRATELVGSGFLGFEQSEPRMTLERWWFFVWEGKTIRACPGGMVDVFPRDTSHALGLLRSPSRDLFER